MVEELHQSPIPLLLRYALELTEDEVLDSQSDTGETLSFEGKYQSSDDD